MRENRLHGSEGGVSTSHPDPYHDATLRNEMPSRSAWPCPSHNSRLCSCERRARQRVESHVAGRTAIAPQAVGPAPFADHRALAVRADRRRRKLRIDVGERGAAVVRSSGRHRWHRLPSRACRRSRYGAEFPPDRSIERHELHRRQRPDCRQQPSEVLVRHSNLPANSRHSPVCVRTRSRSCDRHR